jgi:hypothetical protein
VFETVASTATLRRLCDERIEAAGCRGPGRRAHLRASGLERTTSNSRRTSREISHVPARRAGPTRCSPTMRQSPLLTSAASSRDAKDAVYEAENYHRFAGCRWNCPGESAIFAPAREFTKMMNLIAGPDL